MASKGNRYFLRLVIVALLGLSLLIVAFLNLSLSEVITSDGQVYPERVVRMYAPDDLWVKFEQNRAGVRIQEGDQIGVMRSQLSNDGTQRQITLKREQLALLQQQKVAQEASANISQDELPHVALDQEIALLQNEIDTLKQALQPTPLVATMAGELRLTHPDTIDFMFVRKGDLLAEVFSPDALVVRTRLSPEQAELLREATAIFVEDQRGALSVPARIDRMYYAELGGADGATVTADLRAEQLTRIAVGQEFHVRIVTGERRLFAVLRDVFAR
jgi:uncharacterized small protein (DUF1192 family)